MPPASSSPHDLGLAGLWTWPRLKSYPGLQTHIENVWTTTRRSPRPTIQSQAVHLCVKSLWTLATPNSSASVFRELKLRREEWTWAPLYTLIPHTCTHAHTHVHTRTRMHTCTCAHTSAVQRKPGVMMCLASEGRTVCIDVLVWISAFAAHESCQVISRVSALYTGNSRHWTGCLWLLRQPSASTGSCYRLQSTSGPQNPQAWHLWL